MQRSIWISSSEGARRGACFTRPYLGCREFAAHFHLLEPDDLAPVVHESLLGERDLGWMLHDIDFTHDKQAVFFRARMLDGIVDTSRPSGVSV